MTVDARRLRPPMVAVLALKDGLLQHVLGVVLALLGGGLGAARDAALGRVVGPVAHLVAVDDNVPANVLAALQLVAQLLEPARALIALLAARLVAGVAEHGRVTVGARPLLVPVHLLGDGHGQVHAHHVVGHVGVRPRYFGQVLRVVLLEHLDHGPVLGAEVVLGDVAVRAGDGGAAVAEQRHLRARGLPAVRPGWLAAQGGRVVRGLAAVAAASVVDASALGPAPVARGVHARAAAPVPVAGGLLEGIALIAVAVGGEAGARGAAVGEEVEEVVKGVEDAGGALCGDDPLGGCVVEVLHDDVDSYASPLPAEAVAEVCGHGSELRPGRRPLSDGGRRNEALGAGWLRVLSRGLGTQAVRTWR